MPNVESARKRLRQNEKRRERNRSAKSAMRTFIKKVRTAADAGDATAVEQALVPAMKAIGKNGKKRIIHPRKASRLMSRIQKRANKVLAPAAE